MAPPSRPAGVDGRAHRRTTPGRAYQVPGRTTPARGAARSGHLPYPSGHAPLDSPAVLAARPRRGDPGRLRRRRAAVVRSDRAVHRRRLGAGRLPGPRGAHPDDLRGPRRRTRSTRAATARPRTSAVLARRRASTEIRFARRDVGLRRQPGGRARRLQRAGPDRRRASPTSTPTSARGGEPDRGHRRDRRRRSPAGDAAASTPRPASGIQTVVVWPAAEPDRVNVVITNDLPDPKIEAAVDAFGGG